MALRPSTKYLPFPGELIPQSIITENAYDNIRIIYDLVEHMWCLAKQYLFTHIVLKILDIMLPCFKNSMMRLVCACGVSDVSVCVGALKCSNEMPSILTYLFIP